MTDRTASPLIPAKTCATCRESRPEATYPKDGRGRQSLSCNVCRNAKRRASRESSRRRAAETVEQRLTRKLREQYGLTREQYEALIEAQEGLCAICRNEPESGKRLAIDHCHATGKVRALLCTYCNVVVGVFENHGQAAADYLANYGGGHPVLEQ